MFATTCNVAHDRWPHRFILNDIMLPILVSFIPWHLFSFQITRDVLLLWHYGSCLFSRARFPVIHSHSQSFINCPCKVFLIANFWHPYYLLSYFFFIKCIIGIFRPPPLENIFLIYIDFLIIFCLSFPLSLSCFYWVCSMLP